MKITDLTSGIVNGSHRVSANAMGSQVWFESPDIELSPSAEAFAAAFLVPALDIGEAVEIDRPLDPVWISNVENILPVISQWWGYPALRPRGAAGTPPVQTPSGATALAFSGGVDSFHTLLRYEGRIDYLVFIQGFDMEWDDDARLESYRESLREAASRAGATPLVVRTNIREHSLFRRFSWDFAHGGVLAAIGHLLGNRIGNFVVSSSIAIDRDKPWGSHWKIDKYWSSSSLRIVHFGFEHQRNLKLLEIAGDPLVRKNLRVCWENRSESVNCSVCEKCIRTRVTLMMAGELENYPVFKGPETLAEDIDKIPCSSSKMITYTKAARDQNLNPELRRAIRGLIRRTSLYRNPIYQRFAAPLVRLKSRIFS